MSPALIAIDWGSSSFRAYLCPADGEVLEEMASGDGIASVAAGAYPGTLRHLVGRWLDAPRHSAGDRLRVWSAVAMAGARRPMSPSCRATQRRGAPDGGRGRGPAGHARAGPVLRGRGGRGRDAGRGDGNLRRRRRRRKDHRAARLAFKMGEDRRRTRRRFKAFITGELFATLRDHTVAGAFAEGGARQRGRTGVRARGRARRGGGGRQDEVRPGSASYSARARCR